MTANFFRKYADLIVEAEMNEKAPPGKEGWIRAHKQEFVDRYGPDKGMSILYATAWKQHNENTDVDYTSSAEPMNEYESDSGLQPARQVLEKHVGFARLERQLDKNPKIDNPGAVAASIGRKKYGQAGMTRRSVAGRG